MLRLFKIFLRLIIETSANFGYTTLFTSLYRFVNGRSVIPLCTSVQFVQFFHVCSGRDFSCKIRLCCCTLPCCGNFILQSCQFTHIFILHFHSCCSSVFMLLSPLHLVIFSTLHNFMLQSSILH